MHCRLAGGTAAGVTGALASFDSKCLRRLPLQVIAVCKSADLLLMVLDAVKPLSHREILTRELNAVGIRLNRSPPQITIRKKKTGGIAFNSTVPLTNMDEKLVARILQEYKIHNADVLFREDATVDDFIDVLEVCAKHALLLLCLRTCCTAIDVSAWWVASRLGCSSTFAALLARLPQQHCGQASCDKVFAYKCAPQHKHFDLEQMLITLLWLPAGQPALHQVPLRLQQGGHAEHRRGGRDCAAA